MNQEIDQTTSGTGCYSHTCQCSRVLVGPTARKHVRAMPAISKLFLFPCDCKQEERALSLRSRKEQETATVVLRACPEDDEDDGDDDDDDRQGGRTSYLSMVADCLQASHGEAQRGAVR